VSADTALFGAQGIFIPEGTLAVWGNQRTIFGLCLGTGRKDEVLIPGTILGAFSGDPGYGIPVQISAGRITDGGVFGVAAIPLGSGITDATGAEYWDFPGIQLFPNVSMAGAYDGEKLLIIGDTPVRAEHCYFVDGQLRIGTGRVEHIPNLDAGTIAFAGIGFNYRGVASDGLSDSSIVFAASGWQLRYAALGFDGLGIKGRGLLRLPEKLGGQAIVFPVTRIAADGLLTSGNLDGLRDTVRFQHVPLQSDGVSLRTLDGNYVLEIAYPLASLKSVDGPDILFGKTIFDSEGSVVRGDTERRRIDFTSANNYVMALENSKIENDGLILEGSVDLQWFGRKITIPAGRFRILPDYRII
jgi:hypothetical protein